MGASASAGSGSDGIAPSFPGSGVGVGALIASPGKDVISQVATMLLMIRYEKTARIIAMLNKKMIDRILRQLMVLLSDCVVALMYFLFQMRDYNIKNFFR
jgi:hypothetical protein